MPKKTATTNPKTTRSTSRARSRVSTVVTSKTQNVELKRALKRRKSRMNKTQITDQAVPQAFLSQGTALYATAHKPTVAQGKHAFSPFILSLKPALPSPEALLEEASFPTLRVNFLQGSIVNAQQSPATVIQHDLELQPSELDRQLTQDVLAHHKWSAWSLPLNARISFPKLKPIAPKNHLVHSALRYETTVFGRLSSDVFVPYNMPEDIFSYFDFPEEDSAPEADLVELDELDPLVSLDEPEEEAPSVPKRSWRLSLPDWHLPAPTFGWQRAIASFVVISFVFVLPLHAMNIVQDLRGAKAEIEQSGQEAVSFLSSGAQAALARDVSQASNDFAHAGDRFQNAKNTISQLGSGTDLLLSVLPMTQASYTSGSSLVEAGNELSIAARRISAGYSAMESELSPTPISRLNILEAYLSSTLPHLETANLALKKIDLKNIPETYRSTLTSVQTSLPALITTIKEFESFYTLAKTILGSEGTMRYLVIFQNNTEIRPTGGFIGSFAEIRVNNGVIEDIHVPEGGSYDLQGSLTENLIAPEPLQILSSRWEFQDANWFPDFPTSARQLMQFYRDAGGPSVDGVLAVNATFIAELIGLLGPIQMDDYGRTINEENFIFEAQRIVEIEYDRVENKPKAFIGDLAPKLVEKTIEKTSEDFLAVVDFLNAGLSQKDLQIYLSDETLQRQILEAGWGGEIKWTKEDYLMVVDTNLGGGKTDGVIQENIDLDVSIDDTGRIINTVTIARTHFGIQGLLFTGVNNVDYLRIYVPKGSILLDATGFSIPDESLFDRPSKDWGIDDDLAYSLLTQEIDQKTGTTITQEHGKTVFGSWVQTKPGTTSTVTFQYVLPFTMESLEQEAGLLSTIKTFAGIPTTDSYTLTLQKQSGVLDRTTNVHVDYPDRLNPLWTSHPLDHARLTNTTDDLFAILFESL